MSSTILERMRSLHGDVEVITRAIAQELAARGATRQRAEHIATDHRVAALLSELRGRYATLAALHRDSDGLLRDEVDAITGDGALEAFRAQAAALREEHAANPLEPSLAEDPERDLVESLVRARPEPTFSGEEARGRYLDLHACHDAYVNVKGVGPVDYYSYLTKRVFQPEGTPVDGLQVPAYVRYLEGTLEYVRGFVERTQPLEADDLLAAARTAGEEAAATWDKGELPRWRPSAAPAADGAGEEGPDPASFPSAEALEAGLPPERVRSELARHGLKAGGRPSERAARLFAFLHTPRDKLDKGMFAKGTAPGRAAAPVSGAKRPREAPERRAAALEAELARLGEAMVRCVAETAAFVEKKQVRTFEELQADLLAEEERVAGNAGEEEDSEEEAEAAPIYNPKNLPIGWDGKPIPYWLYKLHGLNLEYKCEICGNFSYWGPREYERHFQDWRHAHGMRCLGLPNTKEFHGVTLIDDAYALHEKLQKDARAAEFKPEVHEEFEDSMGNVMSRKNYEDLARQGLL